MTYTIENQMNRYAASKLTSPKYNTLEIVVVAFFFACMLVIGVFVYQDYGLTWDDLAQVEIGEVNYKYAFEGDPSLLTLKNRYYGPVFEVLLYRVTRDMADPQRFFTRHFLTYSVFLMGLFFFYFLGKRITNSWKMSLIGCVILAASPYIFPHGFYNSKDIPFMAVFIGAMFTMLRYLDRKSVINACLHALTTAVLITLRAPGVLIFALTIALLLLDLIYGHKKIRVMPAIQTGLIYGGLTIAMVVLFWPILWHDPYHEFVNAMKQMSAFPWQGGVMLYRGVMVDVKELPWHYIPVWIIITTPLQYLVLAGVGFLKETWNFLFNKMETGWAHKRSILALGAWAVLPAAAVILLRSILYDGWRQMFFIYPAIILFSALGIQTINKLLSRYLRGNQLMAASALLLAAMLIQPVWFMWQYHPHQNVYFNRLGGEDMARVKRHYELDYWGLSYKQGLEYILAIDASDVIDVAVANAPGRINARILPADQAARLHFVVEPEKADYFLTNYRYHPEAYDYKDEVYSITVGNASILSVFKMDTDN